MTGFYLQVTDFLWGLDARMVFGVGLTVCMVAFIVNLVLMLALREYSIKKRIWLYIVFSATFLLQVACDVTREANGSLSLYAVSILLLLSIPSIIIPKRQKTVSENQLDFVRFMDSRLSGTIKSASVNDAQKVDFDEQQPAPSVIKDAVGVINVRGISDQESSKDSVTQQALTPPPDFSHVKHVISRLDDFGLSATDKKQVRELQTAIARAENGENVPEVKRCVNDGLGALLKIMSKYGV